MSYKEKTAIKILENVIYRVLFGTTSISRRCKPSKPGEAIEKMNDADRKILQEFTSEDVSESKVGRLAAWLGYEKSLLRTEKEKFDKRMKDNGTHKSFW